MFTVKQAALHACVCQNTVRDWIANGLLPHYRVGAVNKRGKILITREDLDQLLASFRVAGPRIQPVAPAPKPTTRHVKLQLLDPD